LKSDTKTIVQAHTVYTSHVDKNRRNRTFYNGVGGRTSGLQTNNKHCNVRALSHKVKCDCSVRRIRTNTSNLTAWWTNTNNLTAWWLQARNHTLLDFLHLSTILI